MGSGWKTKFGAFLVAVGGALKGIVPEASDMIDQWTTALMTIGTGVGIYGLRDAIAGIGTTSGWKSKVGGIVVGLGGIARVLFPAAGATIDTAITVLTALGGALGLFGLRDAVAKAGVVK